MIRMIVFDMAGTTVNEDNVVYKTLQKAINKEGYTFSLEQVLEQGAGREKLQAIKSILKAFANIQDDGLADSIYKNFLNLLAKAYESLQVTQQPNAVELFGALNRKSVLVVLNTGYNITTAQSLLSKLGWEKGVEFDGLITASDVDNNRPQPDMILLAMKQFSIENADEVVKIGDSIIDIEEGKNAGCLLTVGITTGAHTLQQLQTAHPDYIINNLLELLPILDKANQAVEA